MAGLKLRAELAGDGSGFDAMMKRANASKDKFASAFGGLKNVIAGAFTVGAITSLSAKTIELAGHLRDVSDELGVNVEWFQKRANAAKLAGGSEEDLRKFISTMTKSREEAFNKPGEEKSQRFARLGFSQAEIGNLNTAEFFDRLVKAYAAGATSQAAVDVQDVGGKAAKNLLASFQVGLEGGAPIMSEDVVNQLDEIGDSFEILKQTFIVGFAPVIVGATNLLTGFINKVKVLLAAMGGESEGHIRAQMLKQQAENNPNRFIREAAQKELDKFNAAGGASAYGDQQIEEELQRQQNEADRIRKARQAERDARRKRETSAPDFDPLDLTKDKKAKTTKTNLPTDSLVGIGNFLGRSPSVVNTVANQQLQVAQQQLGFLKQIVDALKSNPVTKQVGDMMIPPA
jgi:hypothetical protein